MEEPAHHHNQTAEPREALDITVRLGSGTGRTLLSAFDNALVKAGVGDFNLVTLSSVIPPHSRVRMVDNRLAGAHGDLLFCVRSEAYAAHPGETAWAGIGWCVDADGAGLFVEHHGGSEETVIEQIELSLADMKASRPGTYGRPHFAVASAHCVDLPTCAIALAAYRVSTWFESDERPEPVSTSVGDALPVAAPSEPAATALAASPSAAAPADEARHDRQPAQPTTPIKVTLEQKIDVTTARRYYQLYRETFGPLQSKAAARQVLHEGEFLEEMVDPRVNKYVAWDEGGQAIGMSTLTSDLATVPWISPDYFAHHYPDHHARGAVYYLGFALVSAARQGGRVFATLMLRMIEQIGSERAVVGWDMCMFNEEAGLPDIEGLLRDYLPHVQVNLIDRQTYSAAIFNGES